MRKRRRRHLQTTQKTTMRQIPGLAAEIMSRLSIFASRKKIRSTGHLFHAASAAPTRPLTSSSIKTTTFPLNISIFLSILPQTDLSSSSLPSSCHAVPMCAKRPPKSPTYGRAVPEDPLITATSSPLLRLSHFPPSQTISFFITTTTTTTLPSSPSPLHSRLMIFPLLSRCHSHSTTRLFYTADLLTTPRTYWILFAAILPTRRVASATYAILVTVVMITSCT
ncbi:hypothetical protein IWZ01DRAFT_84315 [Phyllosticta capitalensis]